MILELIRLEENYDYGTFGVLKLNKRVFCVTLEPRNELNQRRISYIPVQQYWCKRYHSERYPDTFQVMNVPGRSLILFHAGNRVENTQGCIILAQHYGKLRGDRAVLNSGATLKAFMHATRPYNRLHLTIIENY